MLMPINRHFSTTVRKISNTSKKSNIKKLSFRKTFVDPLAPNLPKCPDLVLKSKGFLSFKKLKNVAAIKLPLSSNNNVGKASLLKSQVIGSTDYSNRRNVFNYYGFYTPYLSSNFELRWNRKIIRKFNIQMAINSNNPTKLRTSEIFKMSKDFNVKGMNLSEEKSSKIISKIKGDVERQKRYKERTLNETDKIISFKKLVKRSIASRDSVSILNSKDNNVIFGKNFFAKGCFSQNWYSSTPSLSLFRDFALWPSYQRLASRYVPPKYLYWFNRRVSSSEARNIVSVFGSKYSKINTSSKFSSIVFNSNKEAQLNVLMLKNNIKLDLRHYFESKRRNVCGAYYFVPFYSRYLFGQSKLKTSFSNFAISNSLSRFSKILLFSKSKGRKAIVSSLSNNLCFFKNMGSVLNLKTNVLSSLSKYAIAINKARFSNLKVIQLLQSHKVNPKLACVNLNLLSPFKTFFNFNAFKISRFTFFSALFNSVDFPKQQTHLPSFLHQQVALDKFQTALLKYNTRFIKLKNSNKLWQLRLANLYRTSYIDNCSRFNIYRLLGCGLWNFDLKRLNNHSKLSSQALNLFCNKKIMLSQVGKTLYGKQHFYFRSAVFAMLRRSLHKNNSILYSISKGSNLKTKMSKHIFKPSHIGRINKAIKNSPIDTLAKLRHANYLNLTSGSWKNNVNIIMNVATRYINKYKDVRLKLKSNNNLSLTLALKKQLFSLRWIAIKLLPLVVSLKKFILNLKSKTYTSSFKNSFMAYTSYQTLSIVSHIVNLPFTSKITYTQTSDSVFNAISPNILYDFKKLQYVYSFFKSNSQNLEHFRKGLNSIYNKAYFKAFNSIKSFAFINKKFISSSLNKWYISNLSKNKVMFNNNFKSFSILNSLNLPEKRKIYHSTFKQVLSTFILKSAYYTNKKLSSKLKSYRRWNALTVLQSIIKINSKELSSQQLTIWLNTVNNFFKSSYSTNHPVFKLISSTSVGRILPQRRYIIPANLNATKNLYLKVVVDRASFFVFHKSLSTFDISLIDSQTGQSLNFLNNYSIASNMYKNVIVDILSSDNMNKYSNRVKFFSVFTSNLKENGVAHIFRNKFSSLKINTPKCTRFNFKSNQSFFETSNISTTSFETHSYFNLYKSFSKLRVSIIKSPVFIRKVEPQNINVTAVFKNIMLPDIYRDKTNYLRLSWIKPDISFELPKWLFSSWDEESKQLFCWDMLLKLAVYRQNQFKTSSLLLNNSTQYLPSNSFLAFDEAFKKTSFEPYKKDRKYKSNPVKKYYRGELPSETTIVELLSNFSNIYTSPKSNELTDVLNYKTRYVINKLLKVFDTGNMLKEYSDSNKLLYLKASLILINKKKKILNEFRNNSYSNMCFNNYTKVSMQKKSLEVPFNVDREPLLKFHLYRVEMPIKAFLQKMNTRREILRNINNNNDIRKNLKKFSSLKNIKSKNNRIVKSQNHALRQNYKMLRRTENAFGLGMLRKSYKNTLWRKRLRNYTYRILSHNFKNELESYTKEEGNVYLKRTVAFRQRSRRRWFKKTRRRELFPPTKIPKASKNSWTLSLRRFYKHKLIMRKYIFHSLGNINYKQFYKIYDSTKSLQQNRIFNFVNRIESRLDMFMLRLNFGKTALSIHQLIRHGHVKVNHQTITFPQYQLKTNDQISLLIPDKTHDYYNSMYKKNHIQNSFQLTLKNAPVMRLSIHAPARFFALLSVKRLLFFRYKRIHFDLLKKNGGQFSLTNKGFHLPLNNFLRLQFGFMYQLPASIEALRGSLRITNIVNYDIFEVLKYRNPR